MSRLHLRVEQQQRVRRGGAGGGGEAGDEAAAGGDLGGGQPQRGCRHGAVHVDHRLRQDGVQLSEHRHAAYKCDDIELHMNHRRSFSITDKAKLGRKIGMPYANEIIIFI